MTDITHWLRGGTATDDRPIVLLLHGAGSNERDLVGLVPDDFAWASLRAPHELDGSGAVWFRSRRPQPPDPLDVSHSLQAIWRWVDREVGDAARVTPVGFSQGGYMTLRLLQDAPDRVTAPAILSGLLLGDATEHHAALATRRPRLFWGRGQHDPLISGHEVDTLRTSLALHTAYEEHVYNGLGHAVSAAELTDLAAFLRASG